MLLEVKGTLKQIIKISLEADWLSRKEALVLLYNLCELENNFYFDKIVQNEDILESYSRILKDRLGSEPYLQQLSISFFALYAEKK